MKNAYIESINSTISYINDILEIAENYRLDHDYAIDCITYARKIHKDWLSIVKKMLEDPTYKPDLSELDEINY